MTADLVPRPEPDHSESNGCRERVWQALQDLTDLAAHVADAPVAALALLDRGRVHCLTHGDGPALVRSRLMGAGVQSIVERRVISGTDGASEEPTEDGAASEHARVRFSVSVPVLVAGGHAIGSLTVLDYRRRTLRREQEAALEDVARRVALHLEAFRAAHPLRQAG